MSALAQWTIFAMPPREARFQIPNARPTSIQVVAALTSADWVHGFHNVTEMQFDGDLIYPPSQTWMAFDSMPRLVLAPGAGTKTVQAKIRNSSAVESDWMTSTVDLSPSAEIVALDYQWNHPLDVRGNTPMLWTTSVDLAEWEIRIVASENATRDEASEPVAQGGTISAGDLVSTTLTTADLIAASLPAGVVRSGSYTVRVFGRPAGSNDWI